jgi:hypothetical protein
LIGDQKESFCVFCGFNFCLLKGAKSRSICVSRERERKPRSGLRSRVRIEVVLFRNNELFTQIKEETIHFQNARLATVYPDNLPSDPARFLGFSRRHPLQSIYFGVYLIVHSAVVSVAAKPDSPNEPRVYPLLMRTTLRLQAKPANVMRGMK